MANSVIVKDRYLTRHQERSLDSSDNLNTFIGRDYEGVYYIGSALPINCPNGYSHLLVLGVSGITTIQVLFAPSYVFFRSYSGSPVTWSSWRELKWAFQLQDTTYTNIPLRFFGYVSSNGTVASLCIPFNFPSSATSITITKCMVNMRLPTGGYIIGINYDASDKVDATTLIKGQSLLQINLKKSDGWGVTNNIPIVGDVSLSFILN